jgi:hypothetical protein
MCVSQERKLREDVRGAGAADVARLHHDVEALEVRFFSLSLSLCVLVYE